MKPKVLNSSNNAEGCTFVENFTFCSKHKVPLYDISTMGAFNQLVGFAKFTNSEYGNVYYLAGQGAGPCPAEDTEVRKRTMEGNKF